MVFIMSNKLIDQIGISRLSGKQKLVLYSTFVLLLSLSLTVYQVKREQEIRSRAQVASFRFISWGDTKSGTNLLSELSDQAAGFNPVLTIYSGDLEGISIELLPVSVLFNLEDGQPLFMIELLSLALWSTF